MKFEVVYTEKGLKFYKRIKGLFGRERLKEVKDKEVFAPLMISGKLFPEIENLPLDDILWLKQEYNIENHLSDFGCEVDFEINRYEDKLVETQSGYSGEVSFDGIIKNTEKNKDICSFTINTRVIDSEYKPTKKFYEALFANTYSGVYGSLKKVDELYDSMKIKKRWECEECGEEFENRLEFLSHLIETKHYDSVFEEYLHDKDVLFVKNRLQKSEN